MKLRTKPNNPRQISKREYERLKADLEKYGDLGGIVHNVTTGNLVCGNQRASVMQLLGDGADIVITDEYDPPTATGTTARGFVEWRGERYDYRRVAWDEATEDEACVIANLRGGSWDWDVLAGWDSTALHDWGFDDATLTTWNDNAANLREMLTVDDESAEFAGHDEQAADDVEMITCPHCGESFPYPRIS